jgi:hypothetical protein
MAVLAATPLLINACLNVKNTTRKKKQNVDRDEGILNAFLFI